jgi:hypothetical protein
MSKLHRRIAICTLGVAFATLSIASAQEYTTIDFPGAVSTSLNGGPNPQGTNIGSYTDTGGVTHGFVLYKGGFTSFDPPGSALTVPNWISPQGVIVGQYFDAGGVSHGFTLAGGNYTTVDFPGGAGSFLTSLNPSGEMTGELCELASCSASSITHSFVVSKDGTFSDFDPPGATSSLAVTVTATGSVFGSYTDSTGVGHGYELYHGTFTTIDFPGAVFTFTGGANPEGDSVGLYTDTSNVSHSFLLRKGVFTSFDPPGAVFSDAAGINPSGVIVGLYFDAAGVEHGYIRTP